MEKIATCESITIKRFLVRVGVVCWYTKKHCDDTKRFRTFYQVKKSYLKYGKRIKRVWIGYNIKS